MPRGQALVLFSFCMLLLVLMVTMTLSFGTKAKEKMEVQMVADTAAYSTAVATARTYNLLAVNNRVMIAHMVAMLGINSAASFASITVGISWGLLWHYFSIELPHQISRCNPPWQICGCIGAIAVGLNRILPLTLEFIDSRNFVLMFDPLLGAQSNRTSLAAVTLYGSAFASYGLFYATQLSGQNVARRIADDAASRYPGEWGVQGGGDSVARRESGLFPFFDGAINVSNLILTDRHAVYMAMASRGHPFTAGRGGIGAFSLSGATQVLDRYMRRFVNNDIQFFANGGNAYYGNFAHSNWLMMASSSRAFADDHVFIIPRYAGPGCTGLAIPLLFQPASLMWSRAVPAEGYHASGSGFQLPNPIPGTFGPGTPFFLFIPLIFDAAHFQSGACIAGCPSAWTNFVDSNYNPFLYSEGNNWNQPKLPVTVRRNMRLRPSGADPWNLAFNYRFNPATTGTRFDTRSDNGILLRDGTDISLQTAYATGITYFHRAQHLKEPPNLFSPFWRAGLTRADVDDSAVGDVEQVLNDSNVPWAATTFRELWNVGFRGVP